MAKYSFVKQGNIKHSREVVMKHIKKLQPFNYNKFMWWRTHTDKVVPLGKRAPLKERILNGEFDPSSYFWQAQLSLYAALDKVNLETDDHQKQVEMLQLDMARHKRLMEDFEKEEPARMEALYDAFISAFKLTREELEEKFLKFNGPILDFYYYAEEFLYKLPAANRKEMRGRPKKVLNQPLPKVLQPKRGRGRPKKS